MLIIWHKAGEQNMEFWLKQDNDNSGFQLPVNPSSYEIADLMNNGSFDTEMGGERSFLGTEKLKTFEIDSFFPYEKYPFLLCVPKENPYDYVKVINSWKNNKWPVRVIITGTPINLLCSIEEFHYGEEAGSRDVNFKLMLKEYIEVNGVIFQDATVTSAKTATASSSQSSGDAIIKLLQQNLNKLKIPDKTLDANGINDTATKDALKKFQSIMGLQQNGLYNVDESTAVNEVLSKPTCGVPYVHRYATRYIQWVVGTNIDGIFYTATKIAVQSFQKNNGLTANGIVETETWNKMF